MFLPTRAFGFENERKAVSLLFLGFYIAFFGFLAVLIANLPKEPDFDALRPWWRCYAALSACYGIGFFALAANWFWGRWFALGLAYSGVTTSLWVMVSIRYAAAPFLFYGITHGIISLCLQGEKLIAQYDLKPEWREKFHLDEEGVYRVRKTAIRAVSSLPALILYALAPREKMSFDLLALMSVGSVLLGVSGLFVARVWGIIALCGSAILIVLSGLFSSPISSSSLLGAHFWGSRGTLGFGFFHMLPWIALSFVMIALIPMAQPICRFLRKSSSS